MKRTIGMLTAIAVLAIPAASAQAKIVYTKSSGKFYTATNFGKNDKLIGTGDIAQLTRDGQTIIYSNKTDALLKVPAAGGPSSALGGGLQWCQKCFVASSPDSKSLLLFGAKGELDLVPLDGSAPTRLATGVYNWATYSPDLTRVAFDQSWADSAGDGVSLFTTPVVGGTPASLANFATTPIWTKAGIVASTVVRVGNKPQFRVVLLNATGGVARVLQRTTVQNEKQLKSGMGIQYPAWAAGSNVLTTAIGPYKTTVVRLISTRNGKVKAKRVIKATEEITATNSTGTTLLVVGKGGKLQSVDVNTGHRRTLVMSGVWSADISG